MVPPPAINNVVTPLVCKDRPRTLVLQGSAILRIRKQANASTEETYIPSVFFSDVAFDSGDVSTINCSVAAFTLPDGSLKPFANVSGWTVELCALTVAVDAIQAEGLYLIGLRNPSPANCSSALERQVRVVQSPTISSLSPALFCLDAAFNTVTVHGSGFYFVDNKPPLLSLSKFALNQSAINVRPATTASGCSTLAMDDHNVQVCSAIDFEPNFNGNLREEVLHLHNAILHLCLGFTAWPSGDGCFRLPGFHGRVQFSACRASPCSAAT